MNPENYWLRASANRVSRRDALRGAGLTVAGLTGAALLGCGADDAAPGTPGGSGGTGAASGTPVGSGGTGAGSAGPTLDDWRNLSAEDLLRIGGNTWLETLPGQLDALKNGPTIGGTYRFARTPGLLPTTFDVFGVGGTIMTVHPGTHNSLLTFEWKGDFGPQNEINVVPDLPDSFQQPDELTLVFHLRQEPIYFHDIAPVSGREVTVEDISYSIERAMDAPFQGPTYRDVESIETPDDKTVVLKFSRPAAYFLRTSCIPVQWIVAREQVESSEGLAARPIGTGAFQYVEHTRDVSITYERNPRYFKTDPIYGSGQQLPFLDRVEGIYLPDSATYDAAWASRQVDYGYGLGSRTQMLNVLQTRPDAVTAITTPPPSAQPFMVMNLQTPPFNDERVRRGLSMAIDKVGLIEGIMGSLASPGYSQDWNFFDRPEYAPRPWVEEELGPYYSYNPEEARKMLQAAGFDQGLGRTIELGWGIARGAVHEAMADMLRTELGIELDHKTAPDSAAYATTLYGAEYRDLHVAGPLPAWDPDGFTYEQLHSQSPKNFYTVNDPELDVLCEEQQVIFDIDERRAVLKKIMERDLDQMYRLWGVNVYKPMIRDPKLFNASDHYLAWMTPGWGELKMELAWKQA